MVNSARGWCAFHRVALVVVGWLCFAAALVTGNPLLKALFLVTARALPHVLEPRESARRSIAVAILRREQGVPENTTISGECCGS